MQYTHFVNLVLCASSTYFLTDPRIIDKTTKMTLANGVKAT